MKQFNTNKNRVFFILITAVLFISLSSVLSVSAEELSLLEAFDIALEENDLIRDRQKEINSLERDLERILISEDWEVNLGLAYDDSLTNNEKETIDSNLSNSNNITNGDSTNGNIMASKTFSSGLNLTTEAQLNEDLNTEFSISMNKSLFPLLPTETRKNIYRKEMELLKAEENLSVQKASSIISWLESYLDFIALLERKEIYNKNMEKAEENMEKVKARKEIGDAGENQILSARLGLENASYSLEEIDNQIEDAEYTLYKNLALSRSNGFIIKESDSIVKELQQEAEEKINEYPIHDDDFTEQLMPLIIENNYDLIVNQIDREVLEQELEWLNKEDKADISFDSSYDTESEDLSFGINLSYPLYDGGRHEMDLTEQELAIEENLSSYDQLYQDLKQELKQFINSLQLSQKSVKRQELNLEHSQFELDAAEKQLEAGVIDYLDYQEYLISAAEAEFELKSLKNQLFIDRLELLNFIDRDNIAVLIGGF